MNLGALMDIVQSEIEEEVLLKMKSHNLPPSLMARVLEGVQVRLQTEKAREYADALAAFEVEAMKSNSNAEEHTGTKEDLMEALGESGVMNENIHGEN